jgi:hypothetical protein
MESKVQDGDEFLKPFNAELREALKRDEMRNVLIYYGFFEKHSKTLNPLELENKINNFSITTDKIHRTVEEKH